MLMSHNNDVTFSLCINSHNLHINKLRTIQFTHLSVFKLLIYFCHFANMKTSETKPHLFKEAGSCAHNHKTSAVAKWHSANRKPMDLAQRKSFCILRNRHICYSWLPAVAVRLSLTTFAEYVVFSSVFVLLLVRTLTQQWLMKLPLNLMGGCRMSH